MSRSRPAENKAKNPASMFIEWKSNEEAFTHYVKDEDGTGKNVKLPLDTKFIVLDQLSTVTGFDDYYGTRYWSNEVRYIGKDELAVCVFVKGKDKSKVKVLKKGTWKEIKGKTDAKYAKSIYAMAKIDDEYQLVNIKLAGACLTSWITFLEKIGGDSAIYGETVVSVDKVEKMKKGAVNYTTPIFKIASKKLSQEAMDKAMELDATLQTYLDQYLETKQSPALAEESTEEVIEEEPDLTEEEGDLPPF